MLFGATLRYTGINFTNKCKVFASRNSYICHTSHVILMTCVATGCGGFVLNSSYTMHIVYYFLLLMVFLCSLFIIQSPIRHLSGDARIVSSSSVPAAVVRPMERQRCVGG